MENSCMGSVAVAFIAGWFFFFAGVGVIIFFRGLFRKKLLKQFFLNQSFTNSCADQIGFGPFYPLYILSGIFIG